MNLLLADPSLQSGPLHACCFASAVRGGCARDILDECGGIRASNLDSAYSRLAEPVTDYLCSLGLFAALSVASVAAVLVGI